MNNSSGPFLRWAGGKRWFVKHIPLFLENIEYDNYHEPFLGGGSIFFSMCPQNSCLSDLNEELINSYIQIRDNCESVIESLKCWPVNSDQYYKIRSLNSSDMIEQAARFIYLNKTSFNGIYRVNRAGHYNVPYGKNDSYRFSFEQLRAASQALQEVSLKVTSFEKTLKDVHGNDLVFLDPPYTVSHNKNGFIEYNKTLFSLEDQKKLKTYVDAINAKEAYYILTNAAHESILDIFEDDTNTCFTFARNCLLGGRNAKRGLTEEYVFTNIPKKALGALYEQLG